MAAVGLVSTAALAVSADEVDRHSEADLLRARTDQAGLVLATAAQTIVQVLVADLAALGAVPAARQPGVAARLLQPQVGLGRLFAAGSVWRPDASAGSGWVRVAAVDPLRDLGPASAPPDDALLGVLRRAHDLAGRPAATGSAVLRPGAPVVLDRVALRGMDGVAYALADRASGSVLVVQRPLPTDRRSPVDGDAAFTGLDYALYLGADPRPEALTTTNVPLDGLPLSGPTARTTVPVGTSTLTLVTRARAPLGGALSRLLPPLLVVVGLLLTGIALAVARRLSLARRGAEARAATTAELYRRLDVRHTSRSATFQRVQRALVPATAPVVAGAEVASRYRPGAGEDAVGGDWFSALDVDEHHLAVVIGDVSGHGVEAVADMARVRYTLQAHLAAGAGPAEALHRTARELDAADDYRIATAVVGRADRRTGAVRLTCAGHLPPLVVGPRGAAYVDLPVAPPLGWGQDDYVETEVVLGPEATLLLYTDGLVEHRGESLGAGLDRLREAAARHATSPPEQLVDALLAELTARGDGREDADDVALLAVRLPGAAAPTAGPGGVARA